MQGYEEFEIPGVLTFSKGKGCLPKFDIKTAKSTAEVYLQGAQVTGFQKRNEAPLFFVSKLSHFAPGKAIRGGVPICYPWFGPREGDVAHGFARVTEWKPVSTNVNKDGSVTARLVLPETPAKAKWPSFKAEFVITVGETLTMELITTNQSNQDLAVEDCLHTYFAVGDIRSVSIRGLKSVFYLDKADNGLRKQEIADAIQITRETNRTYLDTTGTIEIADPANRRRIHVEKSGSNSTVVWNPWTTQLMSDFAVEEHERMVCVESGNVADNRRLVKPGSTVTLHVALRTSALG